MRPQLTKEEFETYLLIYAAYADYEFHMEEEQFIVDYSGRMLFNKMLQLYQENSDYNSLQLVIRYKDKFLNNFLDKKKIYKTILELFSVDGDYSRGEKTFLQFLDKLIESDTVL